MAGLRGREASCRGILGASYVEGLEGKGCPICFLVSRSESKYAESIVYEYVLDPGVRSRFIESLGLCTYHAWLLLNTADRLYDRLGVAILYLDALEHYLGNLHSVAGEKSDSSHRCFMCRYARDAEDRYIGIYRSCIDPKDYSRSKAIFCLKHLRSVLEDLDSSRREEILKIHGEKLEKLRENMRRYIAKHSYENREPITREEAESIEKAIEALKGLSIGINIAERRIERNRSAGARSFSKIYNKIQRLLRRPL